MTEAHAAAVLAIYQAGIDEGDATFETQAPAWPEFTAATIPSATCAANPRRMRSSCAPSGRITE